MTTPPRGDSTYDTTYTPNTNNCKTQSESSNYTPIQLPEANACRKCNLLCDMQFNYVNPTSWSLYATRVYNNKAVMPKPIPSTVATNAAQYGVTNYSNIIRYYVDNANGTARKDVVFNGTAYQLAFMEVYSPPLHSYSAFPPTTPLKRGSSSSSGSSGSSPPAPTSPAPVYDAEIVLYHTAGGSSASDVQWLAVSVPIMSAPSYTLSQTFFYTLVNATPLSNKSTPITFKNVSWTQPLPASGGIQPGGSTTATDGYAEGYNLIPEAYWTPYQVLPAKKSFYYYQGEFPYAPCLYGKNTVGWIVCDQSVSINTADLSQLKSYLSTAYFNDGTTYTLDKTISPTSVAYNNGELVGGNAEYDRFYVKCVKKEAGMVSNDGAVVAQSQRALSATDELSQITPDAASAAPNTLQTFYTPPTSTVSVVMFTFVFAVLFFSIFAASSWVSATDGSDSNSGKPSTMSGVQRSLIAILAIALFVMYGMSFFTASTLVGTQLVMAMFYTLFFTLYTGFGMGRLNGWAKGYADNDEIGYQILYWVIKVLEWGIYVTFIIIGLFVLVLNPVMNLRPTMSQVYSYFYTQGTSYDTLFYIGTKAMTSVNIAGFQLTYTNGSVTIAQTENTNAAGKSSSLNLFQPLISKTTTSASSAIPTDSFMMIPVALYNPMPNQGAANSGTAPTSTAPTTLATIFVSPAEKAIIAATGANQIALETSANASSTSGESAADVIAASPIQVQQAYYAQLEENIMLLTKVLVKYNHLMAANSSAAYDNFVEATINVMVPHFTITKPTYVSKYITSHVENQLKTTQALLPLYMYLNNLQPEDLPSTLQGSAVQTPS